MPHDLDLSPLRRRVPVRWWWRTLAGDPQLLGAATLGAVMLAVSALATLCALLLSPVVAIALVLIIPFAASIGYLVTVDRSVQAAARLGAFAEANGMIVSRALQAQHYAAAPFHEGRRFVRESVRTGDELFVEVGNSSLLDVASVSLTTKGLRPTADASPEVFLRARLPAPVDTTRTTPGLDGAMGLLTADLDRELRELAGDYTIGVDGRELTVLGDTGLDLRSHADLTRAVTLIDTLAARATSMAGPLVPSTSPDPTRDSAADAPTTHLDSVTPRRKVPPFVVAALVLVLLIGLPVLGGLAQDLLEDHLHLGGLAMPLILSAATLVAVGAFRVIARMMTARRDPDRN